MNEMMQKQVEALRLMEQIEDRLRQNILLINEMQISISFRYCKKLEILKCMYILIEIKFDVCHSYLPILS